MPQSPIEEQVNNRNHLNPAGWSTDGHTLATITGAADVILWDLTDLEHPRSYTNPIPHSLAAVWSPDGHILATVTNEFEVILWDLADLDHPRRIGDPLPDAYGPPEWSPDGHLVITKDRSNATTILWDLTSPDRPRRIGSPFPKTSPGSAVWSPDSGTLAIGTDSNAVVLWDFTKLNELREHAVERACARAGGGITEEAWSRYVPTLEYRPTCS